MRTKRARVTADLRVVVSAMAPGARLPSEHALAQQYDVSRETIRAVLRTLVEEGLIRTDQGMAGAVVRNRTTIERVASRRLSSSERAAGRGAHLTDAGAEQVKVNSRIYFERANHATAELLCIQPGEEVTIRDRVMYVSGEPTQLAVSRLPRTITHGTPIETEDTGPGGLLARLEEAGHVLTHEERVRLHRLSAEEAAKLDLPANSPALRVVRTTRNEAGQTLEVNIMTLVDRYELVYDIEG